MRRRKISDLLRSMQLRRAHSNAGKALSDLTSVCRKSTIASGDKEMLYCREASGLSMLR
jgi:hypothetical protein